MSIVIDSADRSSPVESILVPFVIDERSPAPGNGYRSRSVLARQVWVVKPKLVVQNARNLAIANLYCSGGIACLSMAAGGVTGIVSVSSACFFVLGALLAYGIACHEIRLLGAINDV